MSLLLLYVIKNKFLIVTSRGGGVYRKMKNLFSGYHTQGVRRIGIGKIGVKLLKKAFRLGVATTRLISDNR